MSDENQHNTRTNKKTFLLKTIEYRDKTTNQVAVFETKAKDKATFICLPALGVKAKYYRSFAENLCAKGFNVVTVDWRGNGLSSERASRKTDFGYEDLVQDTREVLAYINSWFPASKIFIIGHSLGGQIGTLLSSRYPALVNGLIMIAACSVHYKGWDGFARFQVYMVGRLFYPLSCLVGYFPGHRIGFGGNEARTLMKDWSYNAITGIYKLSHSDFDYEKAMHQLRKPILAISIKNDTLASKRAVENLYQKVNAYDTTVHLHVSELESDIKKLNHFNWAKDSDYFIQLIGEWLPTAV